MPDDTRISINPSKNPYLTKLTMKLSPTYSAIEGLTVISPFNSMPNIAISQYFPLWRNENFRVSMLWNQNIKNTYNRSHIGFGVEQVFDNGIKLKVKTMFGGSLLNRN